MIDIEKLREGVSFDLEFMNIGSVPETPTPHHHEYCEICWIIEGEALQDVYFE